MLDKSSRPLNLRKHVVVLETEKGPRIFAPRDQSAWDWDTAQMWGEDYLRKHGGGTFEVGTLVDVIRVRE